MNRIMYLSNSYENQLNYINENNPMMYKDSVLVQAALTNYHRLSGLNSNHLFLTVLETVRDQGASLVRLQGGTSSRFPHMVKKERERKQAVVSSSVRALLPFMRALPSPPSYLPNASAPNTITLGVGGKIPIYEF